MEYTGPIGTVLLGPLFTEYTVRSHKGRKVGLLGAGASGACVGFGSFRPTFSWNIPCEAVQAEQAEELQAVDGLIQIVEAGSAGAGS